MFAKFNLNKLKPNLKMAGQRLNILNSKKTALIKQQKREIAELLRDGKEEKARIRVEHLIRLDFTIEAYELLALMCDLLFERCQLISMEKVCPEDMHQTLSTLVYASGRCEVPELKEVTRQIELKYGKGFIKFARDNARRDNEKPRVNERVVQKLGVSPPSAYLVVKYLTAIAEEYRVEEWTPTSLDMDEDALQSQAMPGPSGFSVRVAPGSNLGEAYAAPVAAVISVSPAPTRADPISPDDRQVRQGEKAAPPPPAPAQEEDLTELIPPAPDQDDKATAPELTDYELLQKRFESLRK